MAVANGTGFTATSQVLWNGSPIPTSYQTSQILYATVPANLVVNPGAVSISVRDSSTGIQSNSFRSAVLSSGAASAGVLQFISTAPDGTPANGDVSVQPSISATGRFVAFQSAATNLVSQQVITPWSNIYLRDTCIGALASCTPSTQLISVSLDGKSGGNSQSRDSSVSGDGRYVVFDTQASNLVANTAAFCNSSSDCVLIRDTCIGATIACTPSTSVGSVLPGETLSGGGLPVITPSGRFLTFDANPGGAKFVQTYLRDLCTGVNACSPSTVLASTNSIGAPGNNGANPQSLTPDGRFVGFVSYSTNLINVNQPPGQGSGAMYVRDTCNGAVTACTPVTTRIDIPNGGGTANNQLDYEAVPSLSDNGRYNAFSSDATNLVSQDVEGFGNVYLRDTCVGVTGCTPLNTLVSVGYDSTPANSGSHQQSMSGDGRFIAFTSIATNLVWGLPFAAGSWQDVYVRDTCTGAPAGCVPSTVRVAVTLYPAIQSPSSAGASLPAISADGHYVIYLSSSTNLTSAGTAGHIQVFLSRTGF